MFSKFSAVAMAAFLATTPLAALADHDASEAVRQAGISLSQSFTRAMLPNAPVAGGFLTITNQGAQDDRLIGARSSRAGAVEIHEMTMQGDVMKMRALPDGLAIPAGQTVELKPGGFHLMFLKVAEPFAEGQSIPLTLVFEKAGEVAIDLPVGPPGARAGHGGHGEASPHSGH